MKLRWALLFALVGVMSAQQFNNDIVPASPGLRIGHSNQRWNGFFRNIDISGTCIINGVLCGSGSGGGTQISSYTIATLPPSPPAGTLAIVTDANGPSCTIGGSSTTNLCRWTGFQWVIVSGGSGSSPSFDQVTGGTNTSPLRVGTGGSLSTTGTGTITATNVPLAKTSVLHQFFTAYDSSSRLFTSAQPTFDDITGTLKTNSILTAGNRPFIAVNDTVGAVDGLVVDNGTGGVNLRPNGGSTNINLSLLPKGGAGQVIAQNFAAIGNNISIPGLSVISSGHQCLQADVNNVVSSTGVECGSGSGSVSYPLTAPDGSSTTPQYSFTNHPELGMAVALTGDKPQIRQVVVTGAGPGQTITLTVSSPINNLSWNAGERIIISSLPASPTDLTPLNITAPSFWTISSVTGTSPTGTATFTTASTTITPGTYAVTSGNAQHYGPFIVGRGFGFNRMTSSTTNPAQTGSIRFAARDAIKARAGQSDDTTMDIAHIRGSSTISPSNSPGTGIMTINGAHSSGATTISVAKGATAWSAVAGDQILIAASNGDSDNQKYTIAAPVTVAANSNTNVTITPALKTALNGGELIVTRFIRTQVGEESGAEVPGDIELKGDLTLTSTKPTLIQVKKQSSTPTLNTAYDAGWYLDSTNHFHCKLSVALGGGDCAPLSSGSGYSTIQDEAVAVAQQTTVNFTGAGVSCVDNPGSSRTDCTIPGGSGVTGSGTTNKIPKWTGAGSIGDSSIDDGVTTANTVTISATGGLNITGSSFAGLMTLKGGTANTVITSQVGFGGPATVTTPYLMVLPAAPASGILAGSNSSGIITEAFRSIAATTPVTVSNADGASGNPTLACPTCGVTGTGLGQFASTTSAQLSTVLSDEIGSGKALFASAYQGDGANAMSSGTVTNNNTLCSSGTGAATTTNCNNILYGTSGSSVSQLSAGVIHIAGSTNVVTSSAVNLAGGSSEVTGVLPLANMSQLFVNNAQTTTYQVLAADFAACKTITTASASFTITLVASGSQPASGQCIDVLNYGSGTITIARSGQNINGAAANLTLGAASASSPTAMHIVSDGTNYFAETMGQGTAAGVTSLTGDGTIITNSGSSGAVTLTIAGNSGGIPYFNAATTWASSGALTANSPVLGGGAGAAPKVVAGITTDGTSKLTLGVAGTSVGSIDVKNATSGTITLQPPTGALGTRTLTLPAATDTLVGQATTDTLTNKTLTAPVIATIVNSGTLTLPTSTDTLVGRATTDTLTSKTINASNNTLSNITGAMMTNATVTATQLAAQYSKLVCERGLGDGLNAMAAGTYLQSTCYNYTGVTITITGIKCLTDNNGTSTLNVTNGAGTALLTGAITCTNAFASGTQSGTTTIANADYVKFTFVADGTSKQTDWVILETY